MSGTRRQIGGTEAVEITIRLTVDEHAMLRTLAAKRSEGSEQGVVRALIRGAWIKREANKLRRKSRAG